MTAGLPAGFVDPVDATQVTQVLSQVLHGLGLPGVVDLLGRLPGVTLRPGRPAGLLRRAEPARLITQDHVVVLGVPARDEHVVAGVVLSHRPVATSALPGLLAQCVVAAVTADGRAGEAAVALTSIRDALTG